MEVSALKPTALPALRGTSALLRLQPDERLIAMIRRGQHAAFETLFSRYQPRLLAFCRHMLGSKEDAEDVLQEVFTAAFNAILADEREINVRPWLYRIARNRSLNHLRKASAIGVDSMDIHYAEGGISTGEKVLRRESFRQLIADVQQLPETQRTALLLREIDALSYDQIAEAMETTIPSVKSLLVRARISLAEAAEARQLTCDQVREELGEAAEGLRKLSAPARRHVRACERCRGFRKQLKSNNVALAAVMPVGAALLLRKLLASKLGAGASHVAGGAGAGAGAAAGGTSAAGGLATAGVGTIATKAVAGLAAAALVTAGAVAAGHSGNHHRHRHLAAASLQASPPAAAVAPVVVKALPQPATSQGAHAPAEHAALHHHKPPAGPTASLQTATSTSITATTSLTSSTLTSATETATTARSESSAPATEVVTETTQLPSSETSTSTTTTTTSSATASTSNPTGPTSVVVTPAQAGGTAAPAPTPGEGYEGGEGG